MILQTTLSADRVIIHDRLNGISYSFQLSEAKEFMSDFTHSVLILEQNLKAAQKDLPITYRQAEELIEKKLAEMVVKL